MILQYKLPESSIVKAVVAVSTLLVARFRGALHAGRKPLVARVDHRFEDGFRLE